MPSVEWVSDVVYPLLLLLSGVLGWMLQRELRRSDEAASEAKEDRGKLKKEMDNAVLKLENEIEKVEQESMKRHDKLQGELTRAFSIFAQEGTIDRIESRVGNLDKKVDRVLEMMAKGGRS